jgi:hypothetical protein
MYPSRRCPYRNCEEFCPVRALLKFPIFLNPKVPDIITLYSPRYFFGGTDPITPRALFANEGNLAGEKREWLPNL